METKIRLIPEWEEPRAVAFVWPEHLPAETGKLKNFFIDLVRIVSQITRVLIVFKTESDQEKINKSLKNSENIELIHQPDVSDIWIRDYGPLAIIEGEKKVGIKLHYNPSYHEAREKGWAAKDNKVGSALSENFYKQTRKLTINNREVSLDGGNFTHNGNGTAIITDQIFHDNHFFIEDIKLEFNRQLGIDRLIIVPREPGDVTGHIDGMIRFIDKERIIVGSYPASYTKGKDNISEVKFEEGKAFSKYLIDKLSKSFEVIRVQNSIPRKGPYEFPGAFGNYINFLRIGSKVILPQYNIPEDEPAKEQFRKCFKDSDIKLLNKDVDLLSYYGGVINCISCQIY